MRGEGEAEYESTVRCIFIFRAGINPLPSPCPAEPAFAVNLDKVSLPFFAGEISHTFRIQLAARANAKVDVLAFAFVEPASKVRQSLALGLLEWNGRKYQ